MMMDLGPEFAQVFVELEQMARTMFRRPNTVEEAEQEFRRMRAAPPPGVSKDQLPQQRRATKAEHEAQVRPMILETGVVEEWEVKDMSYFDLLDFWHKRCVARLTDEGLEEMARLRRNPLIAMLQRGKERASDLVAMASFVAPEQEVSEEDVTDTADAIIAHFTREDAPEKRLAELKESRTKYRREFGWADV